MVSPFWFNPVLAAYSMDTDLSEADASFWGEDSLDRAGMSVSGKGDFNGDGYADLLIGAYTDEDGGTDAGQTYLIFGKASGLAMDTQLSGANASFIGEVAGDNSGYYVTNNGDVNGDGYDDILIGAHVNDEGGDQTGQTYLIFGKASGWAMDTDLSAADASFIGEEVVDQSGYSIDLAGDVNGDEYDDLLIGAYRNDEGGTYAGQTYLILGKASGWAMDTDLSEADASFIGEEANNYSGNPVTGVGDVNGDGYDDLLIAARVNGEGGSSAGQVYLILGKASGWAMDIDLSAVDASFIGEEALDQSSRYLTGAGDINGDGWNDFLIGAYANDENGDRAGQAYVIFGYDGVSPVPSSFHPASGLTVSDNTTTISFTTDEVATCRLSLSDESYADMGDDVVCEGPGTSAHSCTTPDLGSDGTKSVYVACIDSSGNADTAETNELLVYTLDATSPYGSLTINSGDVSTSDPVVSLSLSATDNLSGVIEMMLSNSSNFQGASWENYDTEVAWTVPSGDGEKRVYAKFRDVAGNVSSTVSDTILLDSGIPTGTITINSGDEYTNTKEVTLTITGTDELSEITEMILSEDPNFLDASWEDYSETKEFTLSIGDGVKNVYIKYRDSGENESLIYSDSITLDTSAELEIIEIGDEDYEEGEDSFETNEVTPTIEGEGEVGGEVTIEVLGSDDTVISTITMEVDENGEWSWSMEEELTREEDYTIRITVTDLAGNTDETEFTLRVLGADDEEPIDDDDDEPTDDDDDDDVIDVDQLDDEETNELPDTNLLLTISFFLGLGLLLIAFNFKTIRRLGNKLK